MTALRDWTHFVADIGERGLSRTRTATDEERIELARELDILSCESLSVAYRIEPRGAGRYTFSGTLEAEVTQACVVTLDPVPARLSEAFAIELGPADSLEDEQPASGEREVLSIPDIEPIEDGRIEVGTMVFGILSAALPPYPRASGATFDWVDPKIAADPGGASPFAALAKLKPQS
ncbi:DUF177 domain-containing protein [Hyphomicrobium sp.]|uniref:YceD family protein n=1 Tax=Hyphomicrobium sp. TaxID=82 RepID=UPI0025C0A8BA|nr:DUF177 domain-containing protein [Hyphomicrobium sp.]MCC7250805.1 DUF177 domain-containing protein [Hyphomicrobium sp.]